jgi:integrase
MSFMVDAEHLKDGLVIYRRADVQHARWYCRIKLPGRDRYKRIALKTEDIKQAREKAFDHDAEIRFRVKHNVPIFDKKFRQVAQEFSEFQKARSAVEEITFHRWRVMDSHIRSQLNQYVGDQQITHIGQDKWKFYPVWRQETGTGRSGGRVSNGTIRDEMATFRAIMRFAASKKYIREDQVFRGKLPISRAQRDEFTPAEYRKLHTFARSWVKRAQNERGRWYRQMAYNFVLIMTNTGMRPSEAKNLQWRDIQPASDSEGRTFVSLYVRGKSKHRTLVAASNVADYLERVRELSKATQTTDHVFTTIEGQPARTLYHSLMESLLAESGLLMSSSGSRRSTYCFRHTYATFRLSEGVDVYFLAKQMGTSVKMIENHYGHITPVKHADRILKGLPGWGHIDDGQGSQGGGTQS